MNDSVGRCIECGFQALYLGGHFAACSDCGESLCLECSSKRVPTDEEGGCAHRKPTTLAGQFRQMAARYRQLADDMSKEDVPS
jgi:hypothetical protein